MLKNLRRYMCSIGIVFVFLFPAMAFAAPICPLPVEVTQPNGDVITVTRYGDEFFSWQEDGDGNVIAYDKESDSYKYAAINNGKIVPTSQDVSTKTTFKPFLNDIFSRKIQREDIMPIWENAEREDYSKPVGNDSIQLMSADTKQQKPLTDQPLLTILIEFSDVKIQYGADFWSRQMFDDTPGALSVVNYWKENANGKNIFIPADTKNVEVGRKGTVSYEDYTDVDYTITGCSMGVVQVKLDMPHPVKTLDESDGTETGKTVLLVINALEQNFDFSIERPNIVTIFAGYDDLLGQGDGEGQVGGYTSIVGIKTSKGINLGRYTVQGEKIQADVPLGIGIICHEIGHSVFKLPDLYFSTLPEGPSNGLDGYSLMSTGCWGYRYDAENIERNDYDDPYANCWSHVPAHLDPWCKIKCGFVTPTIVNDWDGNINSISDAENTYNVIKVQSKADTKQYFLIENRQCIGFDKGLEVLDKNYNKRVFNGGIIIYHIDENVSYNYNHNTNNHRFMSIERCGLGTIYDNDPAIWPYINTEERNRLNNKTEPNSNFHIAAVQGERCPPSQDCHPQTVKSGISIEVLDESSPSIRVKVRVDDEYKIVETGETFSDVFPDINFCNVVIDKLKSEDSIERSPDDIISAGDWTKLLSIDTLSVKDRNVEDLTGIENFSKLRTFNCANNKLTQLDLSNSPLLMRVNCSNNQLTDINISNSKNLLYFHCENNLLKNLDLSGNIGLSELYCYGNQLEELDLRNNLWLRTLHCYDNNMSENYEQSIKKSENFDKAFPSGSYKFKYLPQKTTEEILTPTAKPTETPMPTPTVKPTETPRPTPTAKPTKTPMPTPTAKPTETPMPTPTVKPTETPPGPTSEPRCAVTTKAATEVEQNTAVVNGELEIYNSIVKDELRYCFWKDGSEETKMVYGSKTTVPPYQGRIYGLESGTKYYYYAYNGDVKGETLSFTTLSSVTPPDGYTYPYRIVSDSVSGDMRSVVIERYKTTSDVAVICASYDERGALSGVEVKTLLGGGEGILDAEFTAAKNQRVFVWENTVSMKPLAEVHKIKSEKGR